jgi:hypothetical protein
MIPEACIDESAERFPEGYDTPFTRASIVSNPPASQRPGRGRSSLKRSIVTKRAWSRSQDRDLDHPEYHVENFLGFVQLVCLLMLLGHLCD